MDINDQVARCLGKLRFERGLSLEHLAALSGVSRAMISRIERAESSPTATVLARLATGLGIQLVELLGPQGFSNPGLRRRDPVSGRRGQPVWEDPATGYRRRTLTPATASQPLQLCEMHCPPGARITVECPSAGAPLHQQIWLLEGALEVIIEREPTNLKAGDCMAMTLDRPMVYHNPGERDARYLVAVIDRRA